MPLQGSMELRWDPYFMQRGNDFINFWNQYLLSSEHDILFVLGNGFDPRMCVGLETIFNIGGKGKRDCLLINFNEGPDSPSVQLMVSVNNNKEKLNEQISGQGILFEKEVQMWSNKGLNRRRTSSINASRIFDENDDIKRYTDIIVDVSALPRAIYFTLIAKLIYLLDKDNSTKRNLHIVVYEDAQLDKNIKDIGVDESASFVHGFAGSSMLSEGTSRTPKVWIPILGENQRMQLEKIFSYVNPDEICPVLPHPSGYPRRSDNLLMGYRELLFDQWLVEPRNLVYASEQNPFDIYRQITNIVLRYNKALGPIGGCKAFISAQSNKLLSIGALLAAYDLQSKVEGKHVGIVHFESLGYEMLDSKPVSGELFNLWIQGECYAP
jgi:hypothetical protein